jgi:cell division transport system permease protein
MSQFLSQLNATLRRFFATPVSSLLNVLVIGIALSLPTGLYVLLQNAQGIIERFAAAPQLSVFLTLDTKADEVAQLRKRLEQHSAIASVEFVSRAQALEQLKQGSGLGDVIGGLEHNPLPDTFIVHPKTGSVQALEALRDELKSWRKLERVQLDSDWARRLEALLDFARTALLLLAALLALSLVAITFNTIRLQILTRRDEIEVAKLIGASSGFIRRPFLQFGLLQGLLGGLAAWGIIATALILLNLSLADLARLYDSSFILNQLSSADGCTLLAFSAFLGWLGAWMSVTQHLRKIEPR